MVTGTIEIQQTSKLDVTQSQLLYGIYYSRLLHVMGCHHITRYSKVEHYFYQVVSCCLVVLCRCSMLNCFFRHNSLTTHWSWIPVYYSNDVGIYGYDLSYC